LWLPLRCWVVNCRLVERLGLLVTLRFVDGASEGELSLSHALFEFLATLVGVFRQLMNSEGALVLRFHWPLVAPQSEVGFLEVRG